MELARALNENSALPKKSRNRINWIVSDRSALRSLLNGIQNGGMQPHFNPWLGDLITQAQRAIGWEKRDLESNEGTEVAGLEKTRKALESHAQALEAHQERLKGRKNLDIRKFRSAYVQLQKTHRMLLRRHLGPDYARFMRALREAHGQAKPLIERHWQR